MLRPSLCALTLLLAAGACAPPADEPDAWLARVDGLPFAALQTGRDTADTILEVNGGGLALFDGDGDGDLDVLFVNPGPYPAGAAADTRSNKLYRNDGDWNFVDVTAESGVDLPGFFNGVAVGDVNSDGLRDLYLTRLGANALLLNGGDLRFELQTDALGAAGNSWSTSAVLRDMDLDGDPDLYVVNYLEFDPDAPPLHGEGGRHCMWKGHVVMCGPQNLPVQADRFYLNEGGHFVDASEAWGFEPAAHGYGLGVIDGDFDTDGRPDLYVTNDSTPNFLFLQREAGRVEERGLLHGAALSSQGREQAGMGLTAGDVEGDGDDDLFVTNFSMESNALYTNDGAARFRERADALGVGGPSKRLLGWGAAMFDLDLDGDLDLVHANGHVYRQASEPGTDTSYAQADTLWLNDGHGKFSEAAWPGDVAEVSRALAAGDLDDDGVLDLVVLQRAGAPRVYRGTTNARSLQVRVVGPPGNPDGVGTRVLWRDAEGERSIQVRASAGYQAVGDPRPVFAWRGPGTLEWIAPDGSRHSRRVDDPGALSLPLEGE
ncbi:MAG: hypothetical protein DHS20C15_02730 [Planctomycetota bacterium]|nr:MAG: hypothetical protein DHS20C15_02730 [Planctomycetota bacterium]